MGGADYFSDSPFRQWLGTNHAISDRERAQLQGFLQVPISQMADLERQIQALVTQHAQLKGEIEAHQALAHPIRRLPNELLQAVFWETLPKDHFPTMDLLQAPLLLTQVCKRWRDLALGTPRLWAAIHIVALDSCKSTPEEVRHHTSRVRRWLRTARPLQLSISLSSDPDYFSTRSVDSKFAKAIVAFAPRIRVLEFKVSELLFEYFSRREAWPVLEKVVFDVEGADAEDLLMSKYTDSDEIWTAPNLKSIEWRGVDSQFQQLPLKWGQMEAILMSSDSHPGVATGIGCSPFILRAMMHETTSLRALRVSVSGEEDGSETTWGQHFREYRFEDESDSSSTSGSSYRSPSPSPPPPPIHSPVRLDKLTTLDLRDTWVDPSLGKSVTRLLHNTYLPVLTSLSYDLRLSSMVTILPAPDIHPLVSFLRAQAQPSPITRWTISLTSICRAGFMECLKLMPALEQLRVKDGGLMDEADPEHPEDYDISQSNFEHLFPDDDILQMLCLPQPTLASDGDSKMDIVCPRLHSVCFDVGDFSVEAFHAFMETRLALAKQSPSFNPLYPSAIAPLRRFYLTALDLRGVSEVMQKRGDGTGKGELSPASQEGMIVPFACIGRGLCRLSDDVEKCGLDVRYDVLRDKEALENVVNTMLGKGSTSNLDPSKGIVSREGDEEWV